MANELINVEEVLWMIREIGNISSAMSLCNLPAAAEIIALKIEKMIAAGPRPNPNAHWSETNKTWLS